MDGDGLLDFGTGLFQGAASGKKLGGTPGALLGGLAMGAVSYFGGAPQRRLERKANEMSLRGMEQDLELGELTVAESWRKRADDLEQRKRKEAFGRLLSQYFQRGRT